MSCHKSIWQSGYVQIVTSLIFSDFCGVNNGVILYKAEYLLLVENYCA